MEGTGLHPTIPQKLDNVQYKTNIILVILTDNAGSFKVSVELVAATEYYYLYFLIRMSI